jgi:hypothetical protein
MVKKYQILFLARQYRYDGTLFLQISSRPFSGDCQVELDRWTPREDLLKLVYPNGTSVRLPIEGIRLFEFNSAKAACDHRGSTEINLVVYQRSNSYVFDVSGGIVPLTQPISVRPAAKSILGIPALEAHFPSLRG